MRGIGKVSACGNVGNPIRFGRTNDHGEEACSFSLAIERRRESFPVWVRCNAYGGNAKMCKERLALGGYVFIDGELMNRGGGADDQSVEIRVLEIIFMPQRQEKDGKES